MSCLFDVDHIPNAYSVVPVGRDEELTLLCRSEKAHTADFFVDLDRGLALLTKHTRWQLKFLDLQASVHIEAADTSMNISNVDHSILGVQAHGRQLAGVSRLLILLHYVVEVHSQASIVTVVDAEAVFGQDEEVLVRSQEVHVDRWIDHAVTLLVSGLLDLGETLLLQDHATNFKLFPGQANLGSVTVIAQLAPDGVIECHMFREDGELAF